MADFEEATNDGEQEEEEEEEEEQASPEEKLQIVQHLLLSSPPGEFDDVLSDAMALVPGDLVSRPMLAGIARAYNNANLRCARAADGTLVLLSERGELEPTLYAFPGSGAYRVDPRGTRSFAPLSTRGPFERRARSAGTPETADRAPRRRRPRRAHRGGRGRRRPGGTGAFGGARCRRRRRGLRRRYGAECKCGAVYESDDASELAVVISGESVNLRNFWSGNWRSEWTVVLGDGEALVSGAVKVRAHYFEDGNVQLQTSKTCGEATVAAASPADLGAAVAAFVEAAETDLQNGLQEMYDNMSAETFKAMRRVMPITRTKMKWNIHEISTKPGRSRPRLRRPCLSARRC
ncbi:hypothetical protein JL722_4068 [Aureococcus anophagefferens]|nr:hypothetical protein JL722_4068 [Aureococcus anophagefferens]